jgi:hypothetical protein
MDIIAPARAENSRIRGLDQKDRAPAPDGARVHPEER